VSEEKNSSIQAKLVESETKINNLESSLNKAKQRTSETEKCLKQSMNSLEATGKKLREANNRAKAAETSLENLEFLNSSSMMSEAVPAMENALKDERSRLRASLKESREEVRESNEARDKALENLRKEKASNRKETDKLKQTLSEVETSLAAEVSLTLTLIGGGDGPSSGSECERRGVVKFRGGEGEKNRGGKDSK